MIFGVMVLFASDVDKYIGTLRHKVVAPVLKRITTSSGVKALVPEPYCI